MRALLSLDRVAKSFDAREAVAGVSLDLPAGEMFCLLGPSGCGKSTLLRLIAGFEAPTSGAIRLDGADLAALPPHRRPVNMMVQSHALFPHMTVSGNVGYGLAGLGRGARAARVAELLRLVRLDGFEARAPDTLSGGQRQRVALARALARSPKVLLLDEPLGALDRSLREETQAELRALQRRLGATFVVVTHDAQEAMALADRIGVMDRGRLVQVGDPATLYRRPASRFVAGLLGDVNLIEGRVVAREEGGVTVETGFGPVRVSACDAEEGAPVCLALRPERIGLSPGMDGRPGTVVETTYLGDRVRLTIRMGDGTLLRASVAAAGGEPGLGDSVGIVIAPGAATALPA